MYLTLAMPTLGQAVPAVGTFVTAPVSAETDGAMDWKLSQEDVTFCGCPVQEEVLSRSRTRACAKGQRVDMG
jgi:hypothetical protein